MDADALIILDGPLGTELAARGVRTPLPTWSAGALRSDPDMVRQIHRDYVEAGAEVLTANTFRTQPRYFPEDWEELTRLAVQLSREAALADVGQNEVRVAGSMSPLEDCYRPDLSPRHAAKEHRQMACALADAGVDLILVETFPHGGEALVALEAALDTGLPAWLSLTAGPDADLLSPAQMRQIFVEAAQRGAETLLVNCVPARAIQDFLPALQGHGLPFGAYANAGHIDEGIGWKPHAMAASRYVALAREWVAAGVSILGACCGTGPEHVRALADLRGS